MPLCDRSGSRPVHGTAAGIVALGSLRCERLARGLDRAQATLAPCFWHACLAMATPAPAYSFADKDAPSRRDTQYFEMLGNRALYHDGWVYAITRPCY